MEDQFGGRTDDDLFYDDYEPVSEPQPVEPVETVAPPPPPPPPAAVATPPVEPPKPEPVAQKPAEQHQPPAAQPVPTAPRGLANSRFNPNRPAAAPRPPRQTAPAPTSNAPTAANNNNNNNNNNSTTTTTTNPRPASPQPPTGPAAQTSAPAAAAPPSAHASNKSNSPAPGSHHRGEKQQHAPGSGPSSGVGSSGGGNTALSAEARLQSGANPRTKLTEAELAAKMEQMRILNAEKTRKFEQAEQDERSHAEAYARGMEEARRRKQADEERRRRGEEERRRMDDERARNRERKLKAMSLKEGGWDEGKDALAAEEDRRAGFRGANGGVRGARSGAGLAGSRFAQEGDGEGDRYGAGGEERRGGRGRGRGRGQGRGGRGGRGGYGNDFERDPAANGNRETKRAAPEPKAPAITTEEFPALPSKGKTGETSPPVLSPLTGGWDDEMEAFDAKMKSAAQS